MNDMKSELIQEQAKIKPYPKLMESDKTCGRTIILAIGESRDKLHGTCVYTSNLRDCLGEYSEAWDKYSFKDTPDSVLLKGD
jgi:hypothetical protein